MKADIIIKVAPPTLKGDRLDASQSDSHLAAAICRSLR